MWRLVIILFLGFISNAGANSYFFVTAPNPLRFKSDETVLVSVFGRSNVNINLWLEYDHPSGIRKFSQKTVRVPSEGEPRTAILRVDEKDIFNEAVDDIKLWQKVRELRIVATDGVSIQKLNVELSYTSGYLIVHTDKPIYTPRQEVNVRVLALDENLNIAINWTIAIDLVNPSGHFTYQIYGTVTKERPFFTKRIELPARAEEGIWTLLTNYTGQLDTVSRTLFEVRNYVLPTFGVTVETNVSFFLPATEGFEVKVKATYVYGKAVAGKVGLTLFLGEEDDKIPVLNHPRQGLSTNGEHSFTLKVKDITNSPFRKENKGVFPTGQRLTIKADVYESATANEEFGWNTDMLFAKEPYIFKFSRSKNNFRPGMSFLFKVDVYRATGDPAEHVDVHVEVDNIKVKNKTTDAYGQATFSVSTERENKMESLTFKVKVDDVSSKPFTITPHQGFNQIKVETFWTDSGDNFWLQAINNQHGQDYTGMMFVVVARGQILWHQFTSPTNEKKIEVSKKYLRLFSPTARLIVFYVDKKTNQVVADSLKFNVPSICRDETFKLRADRQEVDAGHSGKLYIEGSSGTVVALNAMDKALLLLNSDNVLHKNKIFDALKSHERGCGEGSGSTVEEVFKNTGLTLATDAKIEKSRLEKPSCETNNRRKRSTGECYDDLCCNAGKKFAEKLFDAYVDETNVDPRLDPYTKCHGRALYLSKPEFTLSTPCIERFFDICVDHLLEKIYGLHNVGRGGIDGTADYYIDLKKFNGTAPFTRHDFRESWLFKETKIQVGDTKAEEPLKYPSSITEWMFQAIGISPTDGICVAEPLNVTAYKDFFIQLDMPYQAVRLERTAIKATVFNNGLDTQSDKEISVFLVGQSNLCSDAKPGQYSPRVELRMASNTAQTVIFPMIPLRKQNYNIEVKALDMTAGSRKMDAISKVLYVKNEGIEQSKTIKICLDPRRQMNDCESSDEVTSVHTHYGEQRLTVNLELPPNAIPDTGSAIGYVKSNIMDDVINAVANGIDRFIRKPTGCAEQTISKLGPLIYAMAYLKETTQINNAVKNTGYDFIKFGVLKERTTYGNNDGSYSWGGSGSQPSIWLTAFVAKIYCQARNIVDGLNLEMHITKSIGWLSKQAKQDGSFPPSSRRSYNMGQVSRNEQALSVFVLITLLECQHRSNALNEVTRRVIRYVERIDDNSLNQNPFLLAISTYALALAKSDRQEYFQVMLNKKKFENGNSVYWGTQSHGYVSSSSIETTSYALLAILLYNDKSTASKVVRWLTLQRNSGGAFRSTQDTAVGLQALSEYNAKKYTTDINMKLTLSANDWKMLGHTVTITKDNMNLVKIIPDLPVERKENTLTIEVTGTGSARMDIDLQYNIHKPSNLCAFNLSTIEKTSLGDVVNRELIKDRNCDVCGYCDDEPSDINNNAILAFGNEEIVAEVGRKKRQAKGNQENNICMRFTLSSLDNTEYGMSIIQINLQTGVEAVEKDLQKLKEDGAIDRYELTNNKKGFIVLYIDEIGPKLQQFKFRLKDEYEGDKATRQGSTVHVYDYYLPENECYKSYGFGDDTGPIDFKCKGKFQKACECMQKVCTQSPIKKMIRQAELRKRPAIQLIKRSCNNAVADYSILITITATGTDDVSNNNIAYATVEKVFNRGAENLEKGSEIEFRWINSCIYPAFESGKKYYVIEKDGKREKAKDGTKRYTYPLKDTAFVVEKIRKSKKEDKNGYLVFSIMTVYERLMKKEGCNQ